MMLPTIITSRSSGKMYDVAKLVNTLCGKASPSQVMAMVLLVDHLESCLEMEAKE